MITDEIVYTETRVWNLDHARGVAKAIWAKAIGRGHLFTLDTCQVSVFSIITWVLIRSTLLRHF